MPVLSLTCGRRLRSLLLLEQQQLLLLQRRLVGLQRRLVLLRCRLQLQLCLSNLGCELLDLHAEQQLLLLQVQPCVDSLAARRCDVERACLLLEFVDVFLQRPDRDVQLLHVLAPLGRHDTRVVVLLRLLLVLLLLQLRLAQRSLDVEAERRLLLQTSGGIENATKRQTKATKT